MNSTVVEVLRPRPLANSCVVCGKVIIEISLRRRMASGMSLKARTAALIKHVNVKPIVTGLRPLLESQSTWDGAESMGDKQWRKHLLLVNKSSQIAVFTSSAATFFAEGMWMKT